VQQIVRSGKAEETFSVGDILLSKHKDLGEIQWEIIGFNRDTATDGSPYTMTLQSKHVFPTSCFDHREGILYLSSGLEAGTHSFVGTEGYHTDYRSLQFTATQATPGEVILVLVRGDANGTTADTIYVYKKGESEPVAEYPAEVLYYPPQDMWELPQTRAMDFEEGNNAWTKSFLRQYLNEEARTASSSYEIPHSKIFRGFTYGCDPAFLSALGSINTATPLYDYYTSEQSSDLFILPSLNNVCAGQSGDDDTIQYEIYQGETEEERAKKRVKKHNGEFVPYLLRSPVLETYSQLYYVAANGSIQTTYARTEMGFSPICCVM
jgi:hypothetical protein